MTKIVDPSKVREDIKSIFHLFPTWDGEDHIKQYAQQLNVEHWKRGEFNDSFRRWFKSLVRNIVDNNFTSISSLVLIGPQGSSKSLFIRNILPGILKEYYSQNFLFQCTEDTVMSANFINNIVVELNELGNAHDIEMFESLFNTAYLKNNAVLYKRLASFIITSSTLDPKIFIAKNNFDVFVVKGFTLNKSINKKQMFSQALTVLGYK